MSSDNPHEKDPLSNKANILDDPKTRAAIKNFMDMVADIREKYLVAFMQETRYSPEEVEMRYGIVSNLAGQTEGRIRFVKQGDSREKVALNQLCDSIISIDSATWTNGSVSIDSKDFNNLKDLAGKLLELYKLEA